MDRRYPGVCHLNHMLIATIATGKPPGVGPRPNCAFEFQIDKRAADLLD